MLATKIVIKGAVAIVGRPKMNRNKLYAALMVVVTVFMLAIMVSIVMFANQGPRERVYDCSIAEFAPDYPPAVREGCRRIRSGAKIA